MKNNLITVKSELEEKMLESDDLHFEYFETKRRIDNKEYEWEYAKDRVERPVFDDIFCVVESLHVKLEQKLKEIDKEIDDLVQKFENPDVQFNSKWFNHDPQLVYQKNIKFHDPMTRSNIVTKYSGYMNPASL